MYCVTAYLEESRSPHSQTSAFGEKLLKGGFSSTGSSDWRVVTLMVAYPDEGTCQAWTISYSGWSKPSSPGELDMQAIAPLPCDGIKSTKS